MTPVSHLLISWAVADSLPLESRDRKLVTWCGVLSDLDGLGLVVDLLNRHGGQMEPFWYHKYHHMLAHGLWAALLIPVVLAFFGRQPWKVLVFGFLLFHLHYLCDFLGSRGPDPRDIWGLWYLEPFSGRCVFLWRGQWRLDGWQNMTISLLVLAWVTIQAARKGRSPLALFSDHMDSILVGWLRAAGTRLRSVRPGSGRDQPS